ncbi:MAG: AraC family transcriptional regulator [Synechococcus sp. MED-G71]|nr:MAG: AraC family transcriptional regulator [Synechococcus sp. MED-G71]
MSLFIEYKDPLNLSEELARLGQSTRITQFENGGGLYRISTVQNPKVSLAEISGSKTLLYEGWGNGSTIDFNWIKATGKTQATLGVCDGYKMTENSIAGFGTISSQPRNSWGKYSSTCSSTACMVDKNAFIEYLKSVRAFNALERLNEDTGMESRTEALAQLKDLSSKTLSNNGKLAAEKYFELLTACLEQPIDLSTSRISLRNTGLLREIVRLAHETEHMRKPLTLAEVCTQIHTSQASLYRLCQEQFGMGIIEMMTQIRLEESRRVLLNSELRYHLRLRSVKDIAIRFGFKHTGRYARRYFTVFGELPSQTIERARFYQVHA